MDNTAKLNSLVRQVSVAQSHLTHHESDPLLEETCRDCFEEIDAEYQYYLNDVLWNIYDEYCEDFQVENIENYLHPSGVNVESEDLPGVKAKLKIKPSPLRIVATNEMITNEEVLWQVA